MTCHTSHDGLRERSGMGGGWATVVSACLEVWVKQSIRERNLKVQSIRNTSGYKSQNVENAGDILKSRTKTKTS